MKNLPSLNFDSELKHSFCNDHIRGRMHHFKIIYKNQFWITKPLRPADIFEVMLRTHEPENQQIFIASNTKFLKTTKRKTVLCL